jgi:hypothetical protein
MKTIYTLAAFLLLSITAYSQSNIVGIWKLSPLKILTLQSDESFTLKKGAFTHTGSYYVENTATNPILVMEFESKRLDYEIIFSDEKNLQLRDIINDKILNARLIESIKSIDKIKPEDSPSLESKSEIAYESKKLYKTPTSRNGSKVRVSFYGGGRLNSLNHEELQDTAMALSDAEMHVQYKRLAGFNAGLKIGYRIIEGLYAGSGIGISSNGFITNQSLKTNNPIYQYDSEITQSAKYTMYGLQIPAWVSIAPYGSEKVSLDVGGFLGIPLKQTSKVKFENSEEYVINGSYNDKLSNTNLEPYIIEYPDITESLTLGLSIELLYYPTSRIGIGLEYQSNYDYMTFDSKKISNSSIGINLNLRLF